MNLRFDQNLSYRLVRSLADIFPHSNHGRDVGFGSADDEPSGNMRPRKASRSFPRIQTFTR